MPSARVFEKHPVESYPVGVDYDGKAPPGALVVSGVWTALDQNNSSDATGIVLANPTAAIEGMVAKVRVQAGVLGHRYRLGLDVTFDTGDVLHDDIFMHVVQHG